MARDEIWASRGNAAYQAAKIKYGDQPEQSRQRQTAIIEGSRLIKQTETDLAALGAELVELYQSEEEHIKRGEN